MSQAASALAHPVVLRCLTPLLTENELSCGLRLVSKDIAEQLRDCTEIKLSQPVPAEVFRAHWGAPGRMRSLTLLKRREFVRLTALSGSLPNLEFAVEVAGLDLGNAPWAMEAAAGAGHTNACTWLRDHGCPWGTCLCTAAGGGHSTTCAWLLENGCPYDAAARTAAARKCHEELATGLLRHPPRPLGAQESSGVQSGGRGVARDDDRALLYELVLGAASYRDLATLQRLAADLLELCQPADGYGSRCVRDNPSSSPLFSPAQALASQTPDWRAKLEWLEAQVLPPPRQTDGKNRLDRLFIVGMGVVSCPDASDRLAWLAARGYKLSHSTLVLAARAGNLPALQYLLQYFKQNGVAPENFYSDCAVEAAKAGHLAALTLLLDHGVRVYRTCAAAAFRGGHVDVLRLLAERGIRLHLHDVTVDKRARKEIDPRVIPWLVEAIGEPVARRWKLMDWAAAGASVEVLQWLRARGWPWGQHLWKHGCTTFIAAVESGCVEVIEWLLENGCPPKVDDRRTYANVARNGDLATLRYCLQHRGLPFDRQALFRSCVRDKEVGLATMRWLVRAMGCGPEDWGAAIEEARQANCGGKKLAWLEAEAVRRAGGSAHAGGQ